MQRKSQLEAIQTQVNQESSMIDGGKEKGKERCDKEQKYSDNKTLAMSSPLLKETLF